MKIGDLGEVFHRDNLEMLRFVEDQSVDLIYIDPPFNTGQQKRRGAFAFDDVFEDYSDFLLPRMVEARRVLKNNGSLFLHIDGRESHYCKILLDKVFGGDSFKNEIIWSYDYGGRSKTCWPKKHDSIFWYAKDPKVYTFNYDAIDRIPYLAPDLVGPEKAARGKTPTDVWWHTIVPTNGKEKTGYPTQKPLGVLRRIVKVHSNEGDLLVDFFAGSGTFGVAALENNRRFIMIDDNEDAVKIMVKRFNVIAKKKEER